MLNIRSCEGLKIKINVDEAKEVVIGTVANMRIGRETEKNITMIGRDIYEHGETFCCDLIKESWAEMVFSVKNCVVWKRNMDN